MSKKIDISQVLDILVEYTETDRSEITTDSTLQGDLGLSSLDVVNIVVDFEDAFGIEIADEDIRSFINVGDVMEYVNGLINIE